MLDNLNLVGISLAPKCWFVSISDYKNLHEADITFLDGTVHVTVKDMAAG